MPGAPHPPARRGSQPRCCGSFRIKGRCCCCCCRCCCSRSCLGCIEEGVAWAAGSLCVGDTDAWVPVELLVVHSEFAGGEAWVGRQEALPLLDLRTRQGEGSGD